MITNDEIRKIAALSKLSVTEEELPALTEQMGNIIAFADEIAAVEISGTADGFTRDSGSGLRADEAKASLTPDEILKNAGERRDDFFAVKYSLINK